MPEGVDGTEGVAKIPRLDKELERDSEDVRSNRRVWYAKGSVELGLLELAEEEVDDVEFERSIENAAV